MRRRLLGFVSVVATVGLSGLACSSAQSRGENPYESASEARLLGFKEVRLPFSSGTRFYISQGAFGKTSHSEKGNEYQWDFDVPYGTPVVAVEAGTVTEVWEPVRGGGGCDPRYSEDAHNVKVRHLDGTVAQYVHVRSRVKKGQAVKEGEVIAITAENGWICEPQLHFGVYRSDRKLYGSPERESVAVRFRGLGTDGLARVGMRGETPL